MDPSPRFSIGGVLTSFSMDRVRQVISDHPHIAFGTAAAVLFGTSMALSSSQEGAPSERRFDFSKQSIRLEGPEGIRVSAQNNIEKGEYYRVYDEYENLYASFLAGEKKSEGGPCLGTKKQGSNVYEWKTYGQVRERALQFGSALIEKGFEASDDTFVGIYSSNREEWAITDIACSAYNIISVPLYDTLGETSTKYIINLVKIPVVMCDNFKKVQRLLDQKPDLDVLKLIIVAEETIPENIAAKATEVGVELVTFQQMTDLGKENLKDATPGKNQDLFTVCFTSGTTGDPKGVMLTHGNQLCMAGSVNAVGVNIDKTDRHLSYLPLAHSFERTILWVTLSCGAQFGFFSGDTRKLMEDVAHLKPTIFIVVPRVLNRIYDKVNSGVKEANVVKRTLFNWAFSSKKAALLSTGIPTADTMWDRLVFKKLQMLLGGQVKLMLTGAAPVSGEVLTFMRVVFGVTLIEGYGQTESTAGATTTIGGDANTGHVGPPLPCNMIKLVDVPEKDYFAKDDKGEVCFKGSNVFKGYYKKPELTAEALDEDGWLHSGDIGQWLENGTLKIIDRKKHIFKLAQGEYVAPEKLENIYVSCPLIAQIFCYGNSNQTFVVALVIPDEEELAKRASAKKWAGKFEELCADERVKTEILSEIKTAGENAKLLGFEKVKSIHIVAELFSVENGLLTPSMKSKRPVIEKTFKEQLDNLYNNN
ncbi:long-chain-fatty-acid--CoA ligase 1-like isoform X2 [Apostichopus japonicus]|uniref:long-chain-fatty-acid--CoA ligase 1-like isoform X2 n=1 Tax=Stichopus japonicus TaxID=307972 RepID=UPI003AB916AE